MSKIHTRTIHITVLALAMVLVSAFGFTARVSAQADVCPDGGDWVKVNDIDAQSYTYNAPAGKLIYQTCYKAGTSVVYDPPGNGSFDPGVASIKVTSRVWNPTENNYQDISHASFRLTNIPTPTQPTPTQPTPTQPTPTQPTPAQPTPTQPTPVTQSTPAPVIAPATGSPTGPGTLIAVASSALGLSGISLGVWLKRRKM